MKIHQPSQNVLIVTTETILSIVAGVFCFICTGFAVYSFIRYKGTIQDNIFFGQAAAAVVLLLIAVVLFEKSRFVFDRSTHLLTWTKTTVFRKRSGSLGFDAIQSVNVQSLRDTDNVKTTRIVIMTENGELPLSRAYTGQTEHIAAIAKKMNQWVFEKDTEPLPENDIQSGDRTVLLGILALITLICGPLFLILGIYGYVRALETTSWPSTQGVVTTSGMHREIENDEHQFALEYSYTVNDVEYTSNTLYIQAIMNKQKTYPVIDKFYLGEKDVVNPRDYRPGTIITVYYDPDDPQKAVVIPGVGGSIRTMILAGVLLTLIYAVLARRDLRIRARKSK